MQASSLALSSVNSNAAWTRSIHRPLGVIAEKGSGLPVDTLGELSLPGSQSVARQESLELSQPAPGSPVRVTSAADGTIAYTEQADALKSKLEENGVTLWAVRHGQSEMNAERSRLAGQVETPLTRKGRRQALDAAQATYQNLGGEAWLRDVVAHPEKAPVVYASPISRASDTAQIFVDFLSGEASRLGLTLEIPVYKDDRIKEIDFGDLDGGSAKDAAAKYPQLMGKSDLLHRFPNGESRMDVINRVNSFLEEVASKDKNRNVMMFCHLIPVASAQMLMGQGRQGHDGNLMINRKEFPNAVPVKLTTPRPAGEDLGFLIAG